MGSAYRVRGAVGEWGSILGSCSAPSRKPRRNLGNPPENELNLFGRAENLVRAADRMGSHSTTEVRTSPWRLTVAPAPPPAAIILSAAAPLTSMRTWWSVTTIFSTR